MTQKEFMMRIREILEKAGFDYFKLKETPMLSLCGIYLSIEKFDDAIHEKFGDYEAEGKSMSDMFEEIFKNADERKMIEKALGLGE